MSLGLALAVVTVACTSSPGIDIDLKKRSVNGIKVSTSSIQDVKNKLGEPDSTISTVTDYYYLNDGIIINFGLSSKTRYIYCVLNPKLVSKWTNYSDSEKNKISTMPMRNGLIRKYTEKYLRDELGEPRSKQSYILEGIGNITELDYDQISILYKNDKPFGIFLYKP
jgi:hypothetical protein